MYKFANFIYDFSKDILITLLNDLTAVKSVDTAAWQIFCTAVRPWQAKLQPKGHHM